MPKLLIASNNPAKLREFRQFLADSGWEIITAQELGLELPDEEGSASYEGNAIIKAQNGAQASGLVTLADDSGLEVDALGGGPGLLSARYGGDGLDDQGRVELVLARLAGVPRGRRTARFRCLIAIVRPGGALATCEGLCEGLIAREARGEGGFGYDPIFYLPERGLTMAELPPEEKNAISHRGQAARAAAAILRELANAQ